MHTILLSALIVLSVVITVSILLQAQGTSMSAMWSGGGESVHTRGAQSYALLNGRSSCSLYSSITRSAGDLSAHMRKLYWYLTAYFRKHGLVLLGSLIGGCIIFSFLIPGLVSTFAQKPRQYVGLIGEYTLQNLPQEVKREISVGLTQVADDGSAQPYLAERWIVEDEGKTYRFILKKDVYSSEQVVTPDSVQYQFADALVVTTPNDIIFKLPDRFVPFPAVVAEPVIRYGTQKRWFFIRGHRALSALVHTKLLVISAWVTA